MAGNRIIEVAGYRLCINENTYEPAEDSTLLMSIINIKPKEKVLDMGSGSGLLGLYAIMLGASNVTFVDINPFASESTLCTLNLNKVEPYRFEVINCDLLSCLRPNIVYDVAIFNPPYLPFEEYDSWIKYSWSGGKDGVTVIEKFLKVIKAKRIYTVLSSLSDLDKLFGSPYFSKYKIGKRKEITIGYETIISMELVNDD
ncbi:HemK2/MTQ2 family protein methyltransferase [Stygiolobus caldivivus]|uniref:Methyltransferase n=1 Tax=Stygiolobus caldivivus TaxID=2824673 RepID=A0A8D5U7R5_9CREN|nr:HemK2/MTQ2 family protein methyltransferase [Stygiolobus caldivivus]BCU70610.1 methyltransferase [Stygiolobus caldivivus]